MRETTTIELFKEAMKFSAGHFTIFSATERERLHGHNFGVYCAITGEVNENGMLADYGIYKRELIALCRDLDEYFLLPGRSPYLSIHEDGARLEARFGEESIPFLGRDVKVLPIRNVTLEELARHLAAQVVRDGARLERDRIHEVTVKVPSGPGQLASHRWAREGTR